MSKIVVAHNGTILAGRPIETYARSMVRVLRELGHSVIEVPKEPPETDRIYEGADLLLDIDCGRNDKGLLRWHGENKKPPIKSAVYLIDSHGYPTEHRRLAKNYDHVFFAVWAKRDLFENHSSAHWCPNFTDLKWFNGKHYTHVKPFYDFGFFGSKGGLGRALPVIKICEREGWKHNVRQICAGGKHRWPETAEAMAYCKYLFNHSQKHDGPNLRVMESMAMQRPLINDQDDRSGLDKLFTPWKHYVPYKSYIYEGLKEAMDFCINEPKRVQEITNNAYEEVCNKHLVEHRINQILEVTNEK